MKDKRESERIGSLRSEGVVRREREHRRRVKRLIPIFFFGVIAVLIVRQEIPAVDSWISRLMDAEAWRAAERCRTAGRARTGNPGFARLDKAGRAERTAEGYYVTGVMYVVLNPSGEERKYRFSCNVSRAGEILAISHGDGGAGNRRQEAVKAGPDDEVRDP